MKNKVHGQFEWLLETYGIETAYKICKKAFERALSEGQWNDAIFHQNVMFALQEAI